MSKSDNRNFQYRRREFFQNASVIAGSLLLPRFPFFGKAIDKEMKPDISSDNIILRSIYSSGEKIPVVGLGTWQVFDAGKNATARAPLKEVLKIFNAKGGKVIDSSPMYGSSEEVAGDLCEELQIRKNLFFATKVWTSGKTEGIEQMNQSFKKMKTSVMDLMQVHNLVDVNTHLDTLRKWKQEGKIKYIGITHYVSSAYPSLIKLIKSEKLDFVQFNYNMVEREAEKELLPVCKEYNTAVLINQPYNEGNLFRMVQGKSLPAWASDYDIKSWGQFFLKFLVSHPAVTCVIPGTSKPHHMEDNIMAAYGRLPDQAGRNKMIDVFNKL